MIQTKVEARWRANAVFLHVIMIRIAYCGRCKFSLQTVIAGIIQLALNTSKTACGFLNYDYGNTQDIERNSGVWRIEQYFIEGIGKTSQLPIQKIKES